MLLFVAVSSSSGQSSDFQTLSANADAARDRGDTAQAIALYAQAETLNPAWSNGWWFMGNLRYQADQYNEASNAFSHFIALNPKAGPAFALRGLCEFETGAYAEALHDLDTAISLGAANQPRNAQIILYHQALLLTRLGRFDEAVSKYPLLVKGTKNETLKLAVGLAGLRIPLLPREVEASQTQTISMVGGAAMEMMEGDTTTARQSFQSVFDQHPRLVNAHYFFGYLLFAHDPDEALLEFQRELAVSPDSAVAHAMKAWASGLRGDYAAALPDAQKAAQEDPELVMAQLTYGRALVETGDVQGGLTHLEKALALEPGNLEAHLTLAKAYSKLGRSEEARHERLLCLSITQQGSGSGATP